MRLVQHRRRLDLLASFVLTAASLHAPCRLDQSVAPRPKCGHRAAPGLFERSGSVLPRFSEPLSPAVSASVVLHPEFLSKWFNTLWYISPAPRMGFIDAGVRRRNGLLPFSDSISPIRRIWVPGRAHISLNPTLSECHSATRSQKEWTDTMVPERPIYLYESAEREVPAVCTHTCALYGACLRSGLR